MFRYNIKRLKSPTVEATYFLPRYRATELERVWGGRSMRYFYNITTQEWTLAFNGTATEDRKCHDLLYHFRYNASPALCMAEKSSYE